MQKRYAMYVLKAIIIILLIAELIPVIIAATRKSTLDSEGYKVKSYELSSMSGLSCIFTDDYDNIYCFYSYSNSLVLYDKNISLKWVYNLPYSSTGTTTVAKFDNVVEIENMANNTIYRYENGEYLDCISADDEAWAEEDKLIKANEITSKKVVVCGIEYKINKIYPTIYKNGARMAGVTFVQWLFMADFPALAIAIFWFLLLVLIIYLEYRRKG
jgi:hypothetical protein